MRFFNTAGPVRAEDHFLIDPLTRIDLQELMLLIDQKKYFVLHAPRQTGKTSTLLALMDRINREGRYHCLYVNVETAQAAREDVASAMDAFVAMLDFHAREYLGAGLPKESIQSEKPVNPHTRLYAILSAWSKSESKPIVLLIDEVDSLVGDTLISVLRQLRTGYAVRGASFPQSIVLCGVRDIRDYRIHATSGRDPVTGGSAFNVKARSLQMGNFTRQETFALLQQHTDETGQEFTPEARLFIWESSQGQPWLVNALAYELTFEMKANRDRTVRLTYDMAVAARENLILRRETHLDQLADKLREPRVQRVISPILNSEKLPAEILDDDIAYVCDLGLIVSQPQIRIANPIYREIIPRMLAWSTQVNLAHQTKWYLSSETGLLDMPALLAAFQQFFRENAEHWLERFHYKEAGPQLLLQAFLQRVINGGGRIEREYGLGRGRTDLLVTMTHASGIQKIVLELKIQRGSREATIEKAFPQITGYMDRCGTKEGHLIIFDRSDHSWDDKIFHDRLPFGDHPIHIWGM